jgi:hypothetical protein
MRISLHLPNKSEIGYGIVSYGAIGVSLSDNRVGLWVRPTSFFLD